MRISDWSSDVCSSDLECCDIPIFHDDQHGTAVVTLAAMINALKFTGRRMEDISAVVSGAGAAGIAITKLLMKLGLANENGRASRRERVCTNVSILVVDQSLKKIKTKK